MTNVQQLRHDARSKSLHVSPSSSVCYGEIFPKAFRISKATQASQWSPITETSAEILPEKLTTELIPNTSYWSRIRLPLPESAFPRDDPKLVAFSGDYAETPKPHRLSPPYVEGLTMHLTRSLTGVGASIVNTVFALNTVETNALQ